MSDIAQIGFSADTSALKDAEASLNALAPAAQKADKAGSSLSNTLAKMDGVADKLMSAAQGLVSAVGRMNVILGQTTASATAAAAAQGSLATSNTQAAAAFRNTSAAATGTVGALKSIGTEATLAASKLKAMNAVTSNSNFTFAADRGSDIAAYGKQLDDLRAKFNPLYAVIRQYKSNIDEIRQANQVGAISTDEMSAAITRQRQAALTAIGSLKGIKSGVGEFGKGAGEATKAMALTGNEALWLSHHILETGTSFALGFSPMMIAMQQIPKITEILGQASQRGVGFGDAIKGLLVQLHLLNTVQIKPPIPAVTGKVSSVGASIPSLAANGAGDAEAAAAGVVDGNEAITASAGAAAVAEGVALAPLAIVIAAIAAGLALIGVGFGLATRQIRENTGDITKSMTLSKSQADELKDHLDRLQDNKIKIEVTGGDVFKAFFVTVGQDIEELTGNFSFIGKVWNATLDLMTSASIGSVKFILGAFLGAKDDIVAAWKDFPAVIADAFVVASNRAISIVQAMIDKTTAAINFVGKYAGMAPLKGIDLGQMANPNAGAGVKAAADDAAALKKGMDDAGVAVDNFGKKWQKNAVIIGQRRIIRQVGPAGAAASKTPDPWGDLVTGAKNDIASQTANGQAVGQTALATATLEEKTKLLNDAATKNLTLTKQQIATINALSAAYGQAKVAADNASYMKSQNDAFTKQMSDLKLQQSELGMSADATLKLNNEQTALNDATANGRDVGAANLGILKNQADAQTALQISIAQTKDALDFASDAAKGFLTDLQSSLEQGQNIFQAFGDAVENVLNKVLNKLEDIAIDQALGGGSTGSSGGGSSGTSSFLSSLLGVVENVAISYAGGSGAQEGNYQSSGLMNSDSSLVAHQGGSGFAKGGVFDHHGVTMFANGGAMSGGSVVNTPTVFAMGGSGKTGVMGEAGPEAAMPLVRGSDGSLGVQAHGAGGGGNVTQHNVQIDNHYAISGAISQTQISQQIKQSADQNTKDTKKAVVGWLNEYQRNGAMS